MARKIAFSRPRNRPIALLAGLCVAVVAPMPAGAQAPVTDPLQALRALDERVATIGHRLATASRDLCTQPDWHAGIVVHDLSQYGRAQRGAVARAFGLADRPAVLALAAGGPAERAGLRPGDELIAADGEALPYGSPGAGGSFARVERVIDALEQALSDGSATLRVRRAGTLRDIAVSAEPGCPSRFQLIPSRRLNALADGRYVQITSAIASYVADDEELAAVMAHEFAHNMLRHRTRLDNEGVARGFFGNFGRSAALVRETEVEADRLSIYLLDRAGYDPAAAVRFWSRFGRRGLNFLGSATHPNWQRRITLFEAEIARIRRARAEGRIPMPDFLPPPRHPAN